MVPFSRSHWPRYLSHPSWRASSMSFVTAAHVAVQEMAFRGSNKAFWIAPLITRMGVTLRTALLWVLILTRSGAANKFHPLSSCSRRLHNSMLSMTHWGLLAESFDRSWTSAISLAAFSDNSDMIGLRPALRRLRGPFSCSTKYLLFL